MTRLLLILCILLAPALHANPLWNGSESGMQPAEVLKKFEGSVATSVPSGRVGIGMEKACIPSIKYHGQEFSVHFYFNDGGLHAVAVKLKKIGTRAETRKLVEAIVEELGKSLGKPKRFNDDNLATMILKATWTTPTQEVLLLAYHCGPESFQDDGGLVINYELPAKESVEGKPAK